MAILVISGGGRGSGKTAVGCALITAMPEFRWAAVKVTAHPHEGPAGIFEELSPDSHKDTGRYLAAGAKRAFLATTLEGDSGNRLLREIKGWVVDCNALLIESNRINPVEIASEREPVASMLVLGHEPGSWKASLERAAETADAVIMASTAIHATLPSGTLDKKIFFLKPDCWISPEIEVFVRGLFCRSLSQISVSEP